MKNIHILPTENPSSLFEIDGHLIINKEQLIQPKYYRNIYITSDEDLKIGNWVLNIEENTIVKPSTYEIYHIKNSEAKYYEYCKKIILTTDQDLIKDGVQAIDDEFLEWFVKNPSCESVDVGLFPKFSNNLYGIIIPKEEPKTGSITECIKMIIDNQLNELEELKQETCEFMKEVGCIKDICTCNTGPKQETVGKEFYESADEVITVKRQEKKPHSFCETPEEQCTINYCDENGCQNRVRHLVEQKQHLIDLMRLDEEQQTFIKPDNIDGQWLSPVPTERAWQEEKLVEIFEHYPNASPKWQYMNGLIQNSLDAKEMYSKEEVLDLLYKRDLYLLNRDEEIDLELPDKWFEQFKKEIRMKTAIQELRDDLVKSLETGDEALNVIKDKKLRESCQKVVQLTLESIIKRIDEELLEMEKQQIIDAWIDAEYCNTIGNEINHEDGEQYYNETFKKQEQTEL
jgi:hypothetical protein